MRVVTLSWLNLVTEIIRRSEDIYMYCPTCSSATQCTESLETATPIEIRVLNSCCACLIQLLIENFAEIPTLFIQSTSNEEEAIYILSDVLLDVSESSAIIIPKEKIREYLESLKEFEEEKVERIKQFIENILTINMSD